MSSSGWIGVTISTLWLMDGTRSRYRPETPGLSMSIGNGETCTIDEVQFDCP